MPQFAEFLLERIYFVKGNEMKKLCFMSMLLLAASLLIVSCGTPAANNTANKPANGANTATAPAADKAAVEAEVRKAMDDLVAALNKGDVAALDKTYADDYSLVDQNGALQTKASRLEEIKSGKIKWEGLKFSDLKIKTHPNGDGAVVVGRATGKTTMDGKTEERNSMVTWVMGKSKDKGWQLLNAQVTEVKSGAAKTDDKAKSDDKKADDKAADMASDDAKPEKK